MSRLIDIGEPDERLWEMYLIEMRALSEDNEGVKLHPSLSDFHVWLQDQNIDDKYLGSQE